MTFADDFKTVQRGAARIAVPGKYRIYRTSDSIVVEVFNEPTKQTATALSTPKS